MSVGQREQRFGGDCTMVGPVLGHVRGRALAGRDHGAERLCVAWAVLELARGDGVWQWLADQGAAATGGVGVRAMGVRDAASGALRPDQDADRV